jgi:hypothetical protein
MKPSEEYASAWAKYFASRRRNLSKDQKDGRFPGQEECIKILNKYRLMLHRYPNVVEVGLSLKIKGGEVLDRPCISVGVSKKIKGIKEGLIPSELEGCPTDVVEVGIVKPLGEDALIPPLTGPICPLRPGYSIAHENVSSGTFGCVVRDKRDSELLILSNNHVLANSNDAKLGDKIMHPGPSYKDLGPSQVATLTRFRKIVIDGDPAHPNPMDAAVAKPIVPIDPDIPRIGIPLGLKQLDLFTSDQPLIMDIKMTGAKSGFVTGSTIRISVSTKIGNFAGDGKPAWFFPIVACTGMAKGGDSGSLVLDNGSDALGLAFSSSFDENDHDHIHPLSTSVCYLQLILEEFNIELITKTIWDQEYS